MKIRFYERLPMFAPDGGAGAGSGDGGQGGGQPPARPDFVPEKFWDPAKSEVRLADAFNSYGHMEKLVSKRAQDLTSDDFTTLVTARLDQEKPEIAKAALAAHLGEAPEKPDGYKLELAPEIAKDLPEELRDISDLADDPLVGWWRDYAHSIGAGQELFAKGIAGYLKAVAGHTEAAKAEAMKALGETATARTEAVQMFLSAHLPQDQYLALAGALGSAEAVMAIETLIEKAKGGGARMPGGEGGEGAPAGGGKKSETDLRAMMQDRRYWNPQHRDPAYVAEVEAGWKALYPGQVNLATGGN